MKYTLPDRLESLDDLDPKLKTLYVQADDGAFTFKDVSGLQSAFVATKTKLQEAEAKAAAAADQLKAWEGYKLDEVKALIAAKGEIEQAKANQPAEIQAVRTQVEQLYSGKLQAAEANAAKLKGFIEDTTRASALRSALIAGGAREDRIEQLETLLKSKVSIVWDTAGKPTVKVLGDNGMPLLNPDTAEEMTPADVVAGARKDLAEWFKAPGGGGSGAGGSVAAPNEGNPFSWTPAQQDAYARQHGEAALQALITRHATGGAKAA